MIGLNGLLYFMHLLGVAHWENAKHLWGERKRQGRLRWCVVRGHMQTGHSQLMTYNKYTYVRTYIRTYIHTKQVGIDLASTRLAALASISQSGVVRMLQYCVHVSG